MRTQDARSLSAGAQEALRYRAVQAVRNGMPKAEASRVFGVSRQTVITWVQAWETGGSRALQAKRRGRPPTIRLAPHQAALIVRLIVGRCPDQLRLPFALWTREAVQQLIRAKCGVALSVWTVGRYLKRWGLTPQKPRRRAFEQDPAAVRRWLREEYPAIRRQAKQQRATIYWGDEMGLRSDHQTGTSYGRKGQTPVIPGTGKRFRCNVLSTITNRGELAFMVFRGAFNWQVFLRFLRRLLRHAPGLVFLIIDRHPVHLAAEVERWVAKRSERLRLFFLPSYSPDLNPDEFLNNDVKANALGRRRPRDGQEMLAAVRSYLWSTQRQPIIVQSYFQAPSVRYAAA
jgi:transposase